MYDAYTLIYMCVLKMTSLEITFIGMNKNWKIQLVSKCITDIPPLGHFKVQWSYFKKTALDKIFRIEEY